MLYSTHASTFLSVAHLDELALVRQGNASGMALLQPEPLPSDESFRALAEFDAERAEMFLSRAVLLVEGLTEKLALPFVFEALGYEPDSEGILVLETGGKANMSLFARICNECGIPYVVLHDRDAPRGKPPNESERVTNQAIADVAGTRAHRPARARLRERDRAEAAQPPQPQAGARVPALQRRPARAGGARRGGRARRSPPRAASVASASRCGSCCEARPAAVGARS